MDPITLRINGEDYIGFPANQIFALCGQVRDVIKDSMSLPAPLPAEQEPAVGPSGGAAPTNQLPDLSRASEPVSHRAHNPESGVQLPGPQPSSTAPRADHRCAECRRVAVEETGDLCPACREMLKRVGLTALPKRSAGPDQTTPKPRAPSTSSSESARVKAGVGVAAHSEEAERKRKANTGLNVLVVDVLRQLGEGDIHAILDKILAGGGSVEGDDPERAISSVLYYQHGRHVVEKIDGKRGFWRPAA